MLERGFAESVEEILGESFNESKLHNYNIIIHVHVCFYAITLHVHVHVWDMPTVDHSKVIIDLVRCLSASANDDISANFELSVEVHVYMYVPW